MLQKIKPVCIYQYLPGRTPPVVNPSVFTAITDRVGRRVVIPVAITTFPASEIRIRGNMPAIVALVLDEVGNFN